MRVLVLLLALVAHAAAAQTEPLSFSEVQPELVGGIERFQQSLVYPDQERDAGIEGRVIVRFVVEKDGTTSAVEVIRSVSPGLDRTAAAGVAAARFTPGRQNGKPVRVMMTLPVTFRLDAPPAPMPDAPAVDVAEASPALIGGMEAFQRNIIYPDMERRAGVEGNVVVRFVVDETGATSDVAVVRSVSPGLDRAAVAAVRAARYAPGTRDGVPVRVRMILPVAFRIARPLPAGPPAGAVPTPSTVPR